VSLPSVLVLCSRLHKLCLDFEFESLVEDGVDSEFVFGVRLVASSDFEKSHEWDGTS
jgi:hypothetical protein